jgi:glycosyltransferase involved in cell wall biosynthesis
MACGARVACSNTTSLRELAEDYAELFNPEDVTSIARAIQKSLHIRPNPATQGYASAFSWNRCAQETIQVYKQAALSW